MLKSKSVRPKRFSPKKIPEGFGKGKKKWLVSEPKLNEKEGGQMDKG